MISLEVENLTKSFRGLTVVDGVSLRVEAGQLCGFLGPNGSGKTTTMAMILGVVRPDSGTVSLLGSRDPKSLHAAKAQVGAILEQPNFLPFLSGRGNLEAVAAIKSRARPVAPAQIVEVLRLLNLTAAADREFRTYSLGMRQRLALAAALLGEPRLLILDEPTNGLDPEGTQEIGEVLQTLAGRGLAILLSSHLLHEIERIGTHLAIIHHGRLLRSGSVRELLRAGKRYRLRAADQEALLSALSGYAGIGALRVTGAHVLVDLDAEPALLNRYLADREIHLSELSPEAASLRDLYLGMATTPAATAASALT